MSETVRNIVAVKMMKLADVHPDNVEEFKRHGWVEMPDADEEDTEAPLDDKGRSTSRGRAKK
jgi:hypothetical protein